MRNWTIESVGIRADPIRQVKWSLLRLYRWRLTCRRRKQNVWHIVCGRLLRTFSLSATVNGANESVCWQHFRRSRFDFLVWKTFNELKVSPSLKRLSFAIRSDSQSVCQFADGAKRNETNKVQCADPYRQTIMCRKSESQWSEFVDRKRVCCKRCVW